MRALPEEITFSKFLLAVGDGELNDPNDNLGIEHFPQDVIIDSSEIDIVENIYGDIFRNKQFKKSDNYAILSARNSDVNEINEKVSNYLTKEEEYMRLLIVLKMATI